MSSKPKSFPLPLSSIVDKAGGSIAGKAMSGRQIAMPQTATQNAAQGGMKQQTGQHLGWPGAVTDTARPPTPMKAAESDRPAPMVSEAVRKAMVARIAQQGVADKKALAAMDAIPRHLFMEPALASQAYIDVSLPIGHQQTISQPYIVVWLIEILSDNKLVVFLFWLLFFVFGCCFL